MLDHSTLEKLRGMNLTAFAAELKRQMSDSSFSQISPSKNHKIQVI